ncbi:MAG: cell division protein FtsL [Enterococcus sp.]
MAELKNANEEYLYDLPQEDDQSQLNATDSVSTSVEAYPELPEKKLARISITEKFFVGAVIFTMLVLSIFMVMIRTDINKVEKEISTVQTNITEQKEEVSRLEQEKHELTRTERVKQIAEEKGLSINDDNLRTVK